jgi:hypothetical protein
MPVELAQNGRTAKEVSGCGNLNVQARISGRLTRISSAKYQSNHNKSPVSSRLATIGAKLCHDAVNDWVEDVLR